MPLQLHDVGQGPAVLLLHGTPSSSTSFAPLVEALAPHHRVLVPDLPGYRGVPALTGPDRFERTGALLEEALLQRGVEEAAVVGFSGGAYRALALACSRRLRVTRLVLLGGYAGLDRPVLDAFRALGAALRQGADLRASFPGQMLSAAFLAAHPEAAAEVRGWLDVVSGADLADEFDSFADALAARDLRPLVRTLPMPITARVGELDQATPAEWSRELQRLQPAVELQVVPGAGHALLLEDRAATVAAVQRALQ